MQTYLCTVGLPPNSAERSPVSATQEVSLELTHVGLSFRIERLMRLPKARLILA